MRRVIEKVKLYNKCQVLIIKGRTLFQGDEMKKLLALAVLATATTAFAADNREIEDIMYLPNTGTTFGFTTAEMTKGEIKQDAGDTDISGFELSQTIGHSFTDRFSLAGSINYVNQEEDVEDADTQEVTGISDPSVSARFRVMDESFRWDVLGGATIGIGDRVVDEDLNENNLQGGNGLFAGTQFGGKSESFQWAILGRLSHNMTRTLAIETPTADTDVDLEATNDLLLRADFLATLGEKSFLRPFISAEFNEALESEDDVEFQGPTTINTVGAEYQHKLSPDLLLRAGVNYSIVNLDSGNIDDYNVWNFLAGANYQF